MNIKPMIDPKLLERVINASQDGIVIVEQEGDENILIYVNQGFENLTGYTADEILYQDCRFLQGNDRNQASLDKVRKAIKKKEPCREIIRNYRKDGSMFWNELSITPIFDDQNQLTYFIGVQKDVTELMQLREKNS